MCFSTLFTLLSLIKCWSSARVPSRYFRKFPRSFVTQFSVKCAHHTLCSTLKKCMAVIGRREISSGFHRSDDVVSIARAQLHAQLITYFNFMDWLGFFAWSFVHNNPLFLRVPKYSVTCAVAPEWTIYYGIVRLPSALCARIPIDISARHMSCMRTPIVRRPVKTVINEINYGFKMTRSRLKSRRSFARARL